MRIARTIFTLGLAALLWQQGTAASPAATRATEILAQVKQREAPDKRQDIFELTVSDSDGVLTVGGTCSEASLRDAAMAALAAAGIDAADAITVLPSDHWALVRIPVASLRTGGRHAAEMATQAVMGTPLRVLDNSGEFIHVQTPDGYIAYVPSSSLTKLTDAQMAAWRGAPRLVVTAPWEIKVFDAPDTRSLRHVVTDLVNGSIVEPGGATEQNGRINIKLPDGRTGWAEASAFSPIAEWASQPFNPDLILDIAYATMGAPYLWGGTSTKAPDCSGLAKVSYLANGRILMRDASQQATTGTRIEASDWRSCQAGDLLFFGNADTGRVTHVAIYDHDGGYVHSSGRVKHNSVDPSSPEYLTTPFLHAVRIAGNEGSRGITVAADHPWFFNGTGHSSINY